MNKILFLSLLFSQVAMADTLSVPHAFVQRTPAKASEVNLNFSTIYEETNKKEERILRLEADPNALWNYSLKAFVNSNNLTIELKAKDGSDLSVKNTASFGFRSPTLQSGLYEILQLNSSTAITVPNGATLGQNDSSTHPLFIYAINNSGNIELAISRSLLTDEGRLYDTTALSTASDSANDLYTLSSLSYVPIRLLGRIVSSQSIAGIWSSSPTEVTLAAFMKNSLGAATWTRATLNNNWKNYSGSYSTAQFFKSSNGMVYLQGMLKDGVCDAAFFTLPEDLRPTRRKIFMVPSGSNSSFSRIDVLPDGRVKTIAGCNNAWVNIDAIHFAAGQ